MESINKFPNWNGLLHGKENCLVLLISEFSRQGIDFQRWLAVYDIDKKRNRLQNPPIIKDERFEFLKPDLGKFVLVKFECTKVDLDEENAEITNLNSKYFQNIDSLTSFLSEQEIDLQKMELPWKLEYPLGV